MKIYGLMKTTLLDYPGKVASTVFLGGCNFRCEFCHNMDLITDLNNVKEIPFSDVIDHFRLRKGVIDGVCITGGEPTLYPDLIDLITAVKEMGLLVKLDSNGSKTRVLEDLIAKKLLDYIAIDVKASFNKYPSICGLSKCLDSESQITDVLNNVSDTINMLINQDLIDYEFRTTVIREYHDEKEFELIGDMLKGASKYFLQGYVCSEYVPNQDLHGYSKEELQKFVPQLSQKIDYVGIRGMD
ncbi:MAG: anaerobic ribonucleoside-triphosphate reductase activating protein [Lachnospiraceae bacterium]|nr:anaerobic ribonucleoside-triphosphate reductase activating protein [Lachnospiraceae bacterium]